MKRTPHLLAIQSHVVFGHAGNSAAVFPMQRIGVNVWPLNTVQFSNHTQYGQWAGEVLAPAQIPALVKVFPILASWVTAMLCFPATWAVPSRGGDPGWRRADQGGEPKGSVSV